MKKHLFGITLMASMLLISGMASAQFTNIDDIQAYDAAGAPASPFDGMSVTVAGNIFVVKGTYNNGSHYIGDATGGITFFDSGATLSLGDYVEITGTVGSYSGEIQLGGLTYENAAAGSEPAAVVLTVEECLTSYENVGSFVSVTGTITGYTGGSTFSVAGPDSTILCYIDSDTGVDLTAMADGDTYLVKGPLVNYNGLIEIKPRQQSDLVENPGGDTVPVIANVDCTSPSSDYQPVYHWAPLASDNITILADISDDLGVSSATLHYRSSDGVTPGMWMSAAMSAGAGDSWSGVIPGPHSQSQVDFYVEGTDTGAQTVTLPGNAPTGFLSVAVGLTTIYDMQYVHPDSSSTASSYVDQMLNIQGIITAGPGQAGAASKFLVQEEAVNPATSSYAFGGVLVYEGSSSFVDVFYPGDKVRIGGACEEYNSLTEMIPHSFAAVNLVSFPNDLPPASEVNTRTLADDYLTDVDGNGRMAEAWENVWVKTFSSTVMDTTAYGEWLISDTGLRADSLVVNPIVELAYVPVIGHVQTVEGFLNYYYGDHKIVPVSDAYIVNLGTAVGDDVLPGLMPAGGFTQIAPNPFNPVTKISFKLNADNLVQLNVYDIRGQKVSTLVSGAMPANDYTFTWNGTSDDGRIVASGTYFARLRIGTEVMQVQKMSLLK
jgi:DNA/RNA endonuclease YhcR with UshA esterase domain